MIAMRALRIAGRLIALATALLLVVPPGGSDAADVPALAPIKLAVLPLEVAAESKYGIAQGFFAKAGLDAQLTMLNNGAAAAAAVAGGAADVGLVDLVSMINAHQRNVPIVCLAPGLVTSSAAPTFGIIVRGDSPIREGKDFNNKTISAAGLNNISVIAARAWIDNNGGTSASIKFVEIPVPAEAAAVTRGTVDAGMNTEPFLTRSTDEGLRAFLMEKNGLAPTYLLSCWASSTEWIQKNPQLATQFRSAMRETARWANANDAAAAPLLADFAKISPEIVARMHHGRFAENDDPKLVQPVIDAAVKYGLIPASFKASDILYAAPRR